MNAYFLFFTLLLCISSSCCGNNKSSTITYNIQQTDTLQYIDPADTNYLTVFLNIDFAGTVNVFDNPNGNIIKSVKNDNDGEDIVMFNLLQKQDSMYYVIAYNGGTNQILAKGWISQNTNLGVYSAAYGDLPCFLYKTPFNRKQIVIEEKVYNSNMYEVLDFEGEWLKVKIKVGNKFYIGWMPPEMQCANPYTTCS